MKRLGVDKIDNSQDFVSSRCVRRWLPASDGVSAARNENSHRNVLSTHSHSLLIHCRYRYRFGNDTELQLNPRGVEVCVMGIRVQSAKVCVVCVRLQIEFGFNEN